MIYYIYPCILDEDTYLFCRIDHSRGVWRGAYDALIPMNDLTGTRHYFLNFALDQQCLCCENNSVIWKSCGV